ncbi:hypothetical protein AgCh_005472 [Apium graveolens]
MLPASTLLDVNRQLRKNVDLANKVDSLDTRLQTLETSIAQIHLHQAQQTLLLQKLEATQTLTSTQLDANKKGEKDSIISPPALDSIDVIKIAAAKLESNEKLQKLDVAVVEQELDVKWKKFDENIKKKFGPIGKQDKNSDKNPLDLSYETPRPDEKKLLGRSIAFFKDPRDLVLKKMIAKIYTNGKLIRVVAGHPQFAEAKKEEKVRLKQQQKQAFLEAKKPAITEVALPDVTSGNPIEEKQEKQNLYLDELEEVRAIDFYKHLPERLVFWYKGGKELTWPLHRILNEGYSTLVTVFSLIKKNFGFNIVAKKMVLNKIEEIKNRWRGPNALPRVLTIPFTRDRVHLRPYWMMEFKDEKGIRRFFRLEDQLKILSNETLMEMQGKLDQINKDESKFYRKLQNQIEENNVKLGKKSRQSRK